MALVSYNGIRLPYPLHSQFRSQSVYDESGTDRTYTQIYANVQCLINTDMISVISDELSSTADIIQIMRVVRFKLMQQRKALSVMIGSRDLVPNAAGVVGTVDAKNGPQVKNVTINQLTDKSFIVNFEVEGNYWENYRSQSGAELGVNRKGNTVISNRWSDSQEIDAGKYTRRVREGKVVIRSDNAEGLTADQIRSDFAVFGITDGFVRKRASYRVHPDGLSMTYTLEDQEVWLMPPPPAYEANGYYTESTTLNGGLRWGEVQLTLKGAKDVPKAELIRVALVTMMQKLQFANSVVNRGADQNGKLRIRMNPLGILSSSYIRTSLWENDVTVSARFMFDPNGRQSIEGVGTVDTRTIALPPQTSIGVSRPSFTDRGTCGLVLRAAIYFDPSLQQKINGTIGNMSPGLMPGRAGVTKET